MTTAEDFLLLLTDPVSCRNLIPTTSVVPVMGGAFLLDLVADGHLALDGAGRKARVSVADHSPVSDPLLQSAFDRVRHRGRQTPQNAVMRLGRKGIAQTYEALTVHGAVRPRHDRAFGIIPLTRHEIVDPARRDELLNRVRACLLLDQRADAATGPVIALLSAGDLVRVVVDRSQRKRAKERAAAIAEDDWATDGVRRAVRTAQSALMAAIVGVSVAGSSGSG